MLRDDHLYPTGGLGQIPGNVDGWIAARRRPVTVVVVDPHAPVREGLPLLLEREGIAVVATAATGDGGEAVIGQHQPDVALVALDLADADGIVLLRRLVQRGVSSAVVLYTDDEDPQQAALAVHAGAAGVIAKRRSIGELGGALRQVAAGGLWFNEPGDADTPPPPRPAATILAGICERRTATLSDAELRVLALVAAGSSTEAMADELSVSPHTVRTHLRNVMRKLEASSRAHAVAIAIREAAIPA
ncbi:response regulator transcription factor [Conexibacter stalactiti]|uniref:Response regulator transcription factor n=1 Tax=Conexibacter stalactiti TaxID=1940611 RepID=A0ABU4HZ21_9ACTN|nr:response regulator transcription factor [Conexibacter stalactiti]MDW5598470.1 response regulator transcription factor [Conexibacter stalactiti]MEC5039112.1 response regulator transcription factor [Conexibacter stalactiti]